MRKKVKVRWWSGPRYSDPDDVVETPADASDEEIEKVLVGRRGRMEPVVLATAKPDDKASTVLIRDARGKLKVAPPPQAADAPAA
jgi:hypothetical protein